jgi:hypothetical protein
MASTWRSQYCTGRATLLRLRERPARCTNPLPYSESYCQSRDYWTGRGNAWDSLLELLWSVMGLLLAGPLTAFIKLVSDFASILSSLVEHAGAYATSDPALGALQGNRFGTGTPLFALPSGNGPAGQQHETTENRRGNDTCTLHLRAPHHHGQQL